MTLKPGARLRSQVCDTEIIVVSPPAGDVDLTCGGAPVVPIGSDIENYSVTAGLDEGNQLGKRYTAEERRAWRCWSPRPAREPSPSVPFPSS